MALAIAAPVGRNRFTPLIFGCFFLSGTAGLVYETLWLRMIDTLIGGAPYAVSAVLTVFMGGLALGSLLMGRLSDRLEERRFLLAAYGLLEILIGLYALLLPVLIEAATPLYQTVYDPLLRHPRLYQTAAFLGCVILLIVPTTLMGGTLPLLCRYYVKGIDHLGERTGVLYGLNTIGAAFGTVLCGFIFIPKLGVPVTLTATALVNIAAGGLCLLASHFEKEREEPPQKASESAPFPINHKRAIENRNEAEAAGFLFVVSGFCAMAYQIFWTRLIGLLIGPTSYSFTIVVATFILGLAAGSLVFGKLSDKTRRTSAMLLVSQAGAAIFALAVSQILGNSQFFFTKLIHTFHDRFDLLIWVQSLILAGLLIVPTFFLGGALPLVTRIVIKNMPEMGRTIGKVYAMNTIGAILGSLSAGFILIPWIGKQRGLSLVFLFHFSATAIAFMATQGENIRPLFRRIAASVFLVAGLLAALFFPSWNKDLLSRGWYRDYKTLETRIEKASWMESLFNGPALLAQKREGIDVVFHGEGPGGFTTVEREESSTGKAEYAMFNSGKADASSNGDRSTQTLSGHIPLLFHSKGKQVMVLGLASGMTPGEVLLYPVTMLDILEINPQVVAACRTYFGEYNNGCLNDKRTRVIVQDGRNHLALTRVLYDAIISEPSNPWMAGLAALYTREFFQLVKKRLTPQGIFAQWIQSYEMDWETFALLGRTFSSVFPGGALFKIGPVDFMLLARADGKPLDWSLAQHNIGFAQKSTNAFFPGVEFLAHMVITENLETLFGEGPLHTDSKPYLEFSAPRHLYNGDLDIEYHAAAKRHLSSATLDILKKNNSPNALLDLIAFSASVNAPTFSNLDFNKLTPDQKNRYMEIVCRFCEKESIPAYAIFHDPEPKKACAAIQIDQIKRHMAVTKTRSLDHYNLALSLIAAGREEAAEAALEKNLSLDPFNSDALFALGLLYAEAQNWKKAAASFQKVITLTPSSASAYRFLGITESRQGLWEKALIHLSTALAIDAVDTVALNERGAIYLGLEMTNNAIRDFSAALAHQPDDAETRNNMALALARKGEFFQAMSHLNEALRLAPTNENVRHNLAQVAARIRRRTGS